MDIPAGLDRLQAPATTAESSRQAELDRLKSLAAEFEALLLGQMLREMRSSMFEEDDASGFGGGPLADSVYAELSLALGRAGGFGLAQAIQEPMRRMLPVEAHGFASNGAGPEQPVNQETALDLQVFGAVTRK